MIGAIIIVAIVVFYIVPAFITCYFLNKQEEELNDDKLSQGLREIIYGSPEEESFETGIVVLCPIINIIMAVSLIQMYFDDKKWDKETDIYDGDKHGWN